MTLYDIKITREDTYDDAEGRGFAMPRGAHSNVRLTVSVTPYRPIIVPPGSILSIMREEGVESMRTGDGVHLVHRGDTYFTKSRLVDGFVMHELADENARYLARMTEDLVVETLREFATRQIEEMK